MLVHTKGCYLGDVAVLLRNSTTMRFYKRTATALAQNLCVLYGVERAHLEEYACHSRLCRFVRRRPWGVCALQWLKAQLLKVDSTQMATAAFLLTRLLCLCTVVQGRAQLPAIAQEHDCCR